MSQQTESDVVGIPQYAWLIWVIFGALSAIVGVWLILSPQAAIGTLALLLGFGLIFNGIAEIATAADHPSPTLSYLMAILFIIGGIVVFFRPVAGLFGLALVVGISMIVTGIGDVVLALMGRDHLEHWAFIAFLGALGILAGVLAVAWPAITILVLAVVLGIRLLVAGMVQVGLGLRIRSATM